MPQFDGLISLLDSRSFGSIWFWLALVAVWSLTGRHLIGVPTEVITRAHRSQREDPEGAAVITLLDWLSLTLPRWFISPREGAVLLAAAAFALTFLAIMGFGYGLEMAQALTLLLLPLAMLFWLRVWLARRLLLLLQAGQEGSQPLAQIGNRVLRRMVWHRRAETLLSVLAILVAALWGSLWALTHPNGL